MGRDRKRWWHVAFISGMRLGSAIGVALGFYTPSTTEYDADTNPTGWRRHQLATCGWVDDVLKEMSEQLRIAHADNEDLKAILRAQLALMNEVHFREYKEDDHADGTRSK